MTIQSILLLVVFLGVLLALAYPLGFYLAKVGEPGPVKGLGWMSKVENLFYRIAGTKATSGMNWKTYAISLLAFNALGAFFVYGVQRLQVWLPLNPQEFGSVSPDSSFNTAVSFASNTNWQGYGGESTMSYLTQMLALTGQNFFSAATGIAVVYALIRGFSSRGVSKEIGNFWVVITRSTLYVLLPLSVVFAVFLMSQGVIQNFSAYQEVNLIDPVAYTQAETSMTTTTQTLAMGPVASQEAIKMLGTNGGGFFNANSAHPFENPTPLTNFFQMLSIFLIPAALCFAFGRMVGDSRQ